MNLSAREASMTDAPDRVLVVDDDPSIRKLLASALEGERVQAAAVESAEAALSRLRAGEEWDLVITDLRMGEMTGEMLIEKLAEEHPRVDVMVITGHPSFESARTALRLHVREYLEKPIRDVEEFRRSVMRVLEDRRRRMETARQLKRLTEQNRELETQKSLLARKIGITQRNLREQMRTLHRSREVFYTDLSRVMAILENLVDGIVFTDPLGKVILLNPAAGDMLGVPVFTAMGKPLSRVGGDPVLASLLAAHRAMDLSEDGVQVDLSRKREDGTEGHYSIHTKPIRDFQGKVSGDLTLIRDVSIRKKTQHLKNQFLSIVAHELRTPLTTIKAFATILSRGIYGSLEEDQAMMVRNILSQSDRLGHEIDKIINLGRMESEDFSPDLAPVAVSRIMGRLAKPFQIEAGEKGIELVVRDESEGAVIHADARDIQRALRALVENAIKFTPEGGSVEVRAVNREESVVFEVKDDGIGIAPQDHLVIFEKFIQLENPLTRKYGGSGLGLSFALEIVRAHGSRIEVESELGKGATFRFRIPRIPEEALAGVSTGGKAPVMEMETDSTETSQS